MHGRKASTFQTFAKEEKMESKKGPSNLPKEEFTLMSWVMVFLAGMFTRLVRFLNTFPVLSKKDKKLGLS